LVSGKTVTHTVTIKAGSGELLRGQVLGLGGDGKYSPTVLPPTAILAADVDASLEIQAPAYIQGRFKANVLIVPANTNFNDLADTLRDVGVWPETVQTGQDRRVAWFGTQIPTTGTGSPVDLDPDGAPLTDMSSLEGIPYVSY
jgi:hypothetical protein